MLPLISLVPNCMSYSSRRVCRYGDNVEEMDEGVGRIMAALSDHNLDADTIVYFLSDHGGHLEAIADDGQRTGGHNGRFKGETKSHDLSCN